MRKQIVMYIEDGELVDGEVVNEGHENDGAFYKFLSSLFRRSPPFVNWEHTPEADCDANQYQCNSEIVSDYQGAIPRCGSNGE